MFVARAYTVSSLYRVRFLLCRLLRMAGDIQEVFHALCRKMAEETDPEKLELLKQQLRLLLESRSDLKEDSAGG